MSNILEQLEATEPGLERHYFLKDHGEEIQRAFQLKQFPERPPWDPQTRWHWLGWGKGSPLPPPAAASARQVITAFESLPMRERHKIYRRHKDTILQLLETLRVEHFGQ